MGRKGSRSTKARGSGTLGSKLLRVLVRTTLRKRTTLHISASVPDSKGAKGTRYCLLIQFSTGPGAYEVGKYDTIASKQASIYSKYASTSFYRIGNEERFKPKKMKEEPGPGSCRSAYR